MTGASAMTLAAKRPDLIGTYKINGASHFYEARYDELERGSVSLARLLRTYNFAPGRIVLVVSLVQEVVQFAPFEKAAQILGLYGINAELSPFDAGRVESISRQFDPVAISGVGASTLEGLKSFGFDPAQVFAGRTVWARDDAYAAVKAMPGVDARRLVILGPAVAYECAAGGIHYDTRDWSLVAVDGTLRLSSRMPRVETVDGLDTGVAGAVTEGFCTCGTREGCITVGATA